MSGSEYAAAPFDHAKADVMMRSSDNVYFRVFKLFLSLASPFFETLFEIPQPEQVGEDQEIEDGLIVIPVTEDSKTLDALLRFCYPCTLAEDPTLEVLKDAVDVLEAARKYSLDAIEKKVRQAIANPVILEAEPLRCFAIAHRGQLREETLLAAKYTLTQPLVPSWFQEIDMITASDLLSLLTYHKRCGDAVCALRADFSWITSRYSTYEACRWFADNSGCGCRKTNASRYIVHGYYATHWWEEFMDEVFVGLSDKPCKATVQTAAEKAVQTVRNNNCYRCSPRITECMREFSEFFVGKIEEAISQIELELSF